MKKLIFLLVALVEMNGANAQWFPLNSGATNGLSSVYFTDEDTGYAVGWNGAILKTTDGGYNWENQVSGTTNSLASVYFTNTNTGFVVGDSGTILKTTNGGIVWEALESGTSEPLSSVHFPDTETGYVVGNGAIILKTTDGGEIWTSQYWGTQTLTWLNTVHFTDSNTGYACGGQLGGCLQQNGIILKTTDGGVEWTLSLLFGIEYGVLYSLSAVDSNTVFAIGSSEEGPAHTDLVTTIDGGINWSAIYISGSQTRSVFFIDSQTGFVVGRESEDGDGTVLKTTDGGLTWMEQPVGIPVWLNSVHFPTQNTGYIVGDNGIILKTTNGGNLAGCLPEGITFTTQEEIDNFQVNYPGCTEIEGDVYIGDWMSGSSITNLNALGMLTSVDGSLHIGHNPSLTSLIGLDNLNAIGGDLWIYWNAMTSLTGLDNLSSIGGDFGIWDNDALTSLAELDNLSSIGGILRIAENYSLTSLTGLDNINAGSITDLYVYNNASLSNCEVQSICDYLANPNGSVDIYGNSDDCNSPIEVAGSCGVMVPCLPFGNYHFTTQFEIDSFQSDFPNCSDLQGYVTICGSDIMNLDGLSVLTSIEADLDIYSNDNLISLMGLDGLITIGGSLIIGDFYEGGNPLLTSLTGLESLTSIGGDLDIYSSNALISLNGLEGLTSIGGGLTIGSDYQGGLPSLTSLTGLEGLTSIGGDVEIGGNIVLTSLTGLENLTSIGGNLDLMGNSTLTSLSGLDNVTSIGSSLGIIGNSGLTSLTGLENLTSIGGMLYLSGNSSLTSLMGMDNVTSILGSLWIKENTALTSLTGLENLTSIMGFLWISYNTALTSLMGLSGLTSIGGNSFQIWGNTALTTLTGLDNIDAGSINDIHIYDNQLLSTCEVQSVCDYLASPNGTVSIFSNAPGCNNQNQVLEACLIPVEEIAGETGIRIIPNPARDVITVSWPMLTGNALLTLFNITGEKLIEKQIIRAETQLDISALSRGVYFVRVQGEKLAEVAKIIKE
ncbi:MAG: T9SS type A sorting domain-containing protein [Bacteroidales bacterium]|nr:T9SS type A sorting domain-containing protein [Bacteroidales bacterium]